MGVRSTAGILPGETLFVPLHEVIGGNIQKLYAGMKLSGTTLFRVTRDAEFEIDDDSDEALRDVVREQVRKRRYEPIVRLEFAPGSDPSIREMLRERFELSPADVYEVPDAIGLHFAVSDCRNALAWIAGSRVEPDAGGCH